MGIRIKMIEAARALGRDRKALQRWRKRGAPFADDGSVDLEELRAWAEHAGLLERAPGRPSEAERLTTTAPADPDASPAPTDDDEDPLELDGDDEAVIAALVEGDGKRLIELTLGRDRTQLLRRLAALGRTRRELAEAQRRDRENRERAGELIEVDLVKRLWIAQIEIVKTAFDSMPGRLAARLANKSEAELYTALDQELRETLEAFASTVPLPGDG